MLRKSLLWTAFLFLLMTGTLAAGVRLPEGGNNTIPSPTARYDIVFEGLWSQATHPHPNGAGAFPGNPHWSPLIGALHKSELVLWQAGAPASAGVEEVAEIGGTVVIRQEINAAIDGGKANAIVSGSGLVSPATVTLTDVLVTGDFPFLTLISMIAPSPDWFAGVSGLALQDGQGQWREQIIVDLYPYDAGTEEGTEYSTSNPDTAPQQPISALKGVSPFSDQPVARLTLIRRDTPPNFLMLPLITRGAAQ